ncbi:hypothetical protein DYE49_05145 [Treponema rectale]|uniref:Uncharacterized protein n=1 Tax=Treponema rectale TaxID=744512 RepID=A0A840S787_9SPIR|nr:hypothetical protein [Treponema rectale]MBB5218439.1 hypothetical protein [Treponema rectale]QOS39871.1 hypothetical protein DYE49_05145 [Treponema rectale]
MYLIKKVLFMAAVMFSSLSALPVTAQETSENTGYRIGTVNFNVRGRTRPEAIERNITEINHSKIFKTQEEAENYLKEILQELQNTRQFDSVSYTYTTDENNVISAEYKLKDSISLLVFPKPSLDSNSGFEAKLKLKDNNFLGLMEDLNVDINFQLGDEDHPEDYSKVYGGFNFDYDYPFSIGKTEETWSNDFSFSWQIGEDKPEFSYETGITVAVPFGNYHNKLEFNFTQSVNRDASYLDFGDEFYFVESASVSTPMVLGYIGNTTQVMYTPKLSFTYNWDADGISKDNTDLSKTPVLALSQTFSLSRINWTGPYNFRNGYSISTTQTIGWDYSQDIISKCVMPKVEGEIELFKSLKYAAIAIDINFIAGLNCTAKIGSYVRGAADNQTFSKKIAPVDANNYALETPAALVFNFDLPVHIITTHWLDWSYAIFGSYETKPAPVRALAAVPRFLMRYLDFEMQWSPFFDVALIKNRGTKTTFSLDEGIYTGGLEVLVYPARWKSFVIRASVGIDLSKKILNGKKDFDSSWRNGGSLEYFIGLGRHF